VQNVLLLRRRSQGNQGTGSKQNKRANSKHVLSLQNLALKGAMRPGDRFFSEKESLILLPF
jgi:hypothetical protein